MRPYSKATVCPNRFVFPSPLLWLWMYSHASEFPQTLAVIGTIRENAIPGYKPADRSLGVLLPSLQARIVREDGADSGTGEPGELWVKGDCISQGYFNDEQATAKAFTKDGWLKTGDIFAVDGKENY